MTADGTTLIQPPLTAREAVVLVGLASLGAAIANGYQLARLGELDKEAVMREAGHAAMHGICAQMEAGLIGWEDWASAAAKITKLVAVAWPEIPMVRVGAER